MVSALRSVRHRSCSRVLAQNPLAIFGVKGERGWEKEVMERFTDPISRDMNNGKSRKGVKWPAVPCDFLKELRRPNVAQKYLI
jgi:hypothetical protein